MNDNNDDPTLLKLPRKKMITAKTSKSFRYAGKTYLKINKLKKKPTASNVSMNKSKSTNCVSISNRTGGRYAPKTYSRVKPTCSSNGNDDNHPSSSSTATKKIRLDLLRLLNVSSETIAEAIGLDRKLLEITHLRLRILSEDCDFKLLMKKDYPMVRLKNVYYAYFKLPMGSLCFTYNGYNVMDSDTVILLEMKKDDTIHITPKPAGGMYE